MKPTKNDREQYDRIVNEIEKHVATQDEAVGKYNIAADEANEWIHTYNGLIEALREFTDEMYQKLDGYRGERSDKWQESDKGVAYSEMVDSWESTGDLCTSEIDDIELVDEFVSGTDLLENLEPKWEPEE